MKYVLWHAIIVSLTGLFMQFAHVCKVEAVEYQVELFDQLCSEVDNPELYKSNLLKSMRYIVEGDNSWVYRSRADFLEDFGEKNISYKELKTFVDFLALHGTKLMLVYMPTRGLMNPDSIPDGKFNYETAHRSYLRKLAKLRSLGIIVPDLEALLDENQGTDFFFKHDIHWTPTGAEKTAKLVADAIKKTGLIQPQPSYQVVNRPTGSYSINGGMQRGFKQLCGGQFIYEYVQGYGYEAGYKSKENELFGDEPNSETVLIGTSFSALEKLNFIGFLQHELSAPIESYAVGGGGDEGSWLNYAASGDFFVNPPKLIVWELPSYYLLNDAGMLAQLIPTIQGGCAEMSSLVEKQVSLAELTKSQNSLFFTEKLLDVPLSELVLELDFSEADVRRIVFNVWYSNGLVKRARINNPSKAKTEGRFVFSLFDQLLMPKSNVMAVQLVEVEGDLVADYIKDRGQSTPSLEVKVCRKSPMTMAN